MGQVYILKLEGGMWYVGYTERAIKRILQHAEKKGAKWTKKHRPVEPIPYSMSEPIYSKEDEDRITLSMMSEHGIQNVRGGKWCMVDMKPRTVRQIQKLLPKKSGKQYCDRCGRNSHTRAQCYAATTIDGVKITTRNWKYDPNKKKQIEKQNSVANKRRRGRATADQISHSIESLRERNVYCDDEKLNYNVKSMWRNFRKYRNQPDLTDPKWFEVLEENNRKCRNVPLAPLYPEDHWFHNPDFFDKDLSSQFESEGYLWTKSGAAVNPEIWKKQQDEIERLRQEQLKIQEQNRIAQQKRQEEARLQREQQVKEAEEKRRQEQERQERERLEKENYRLDCINNLSKRGVMIEHSMASTLTTFVRYLNTNAPNDEMAAKWRDYFNSVSRKIDLTPLYPIDHWLHNEERFDSSISSEFEHDGFGWTESGTAAKNPNPPKKETQAEAVNDTSIDGIDLIVRSVTKEVEKVGKAAKKKVGKLKKQFKKKFGF